MNSDLGGVTFERKRKERKSKHKMGMLLGAITWIINRWALRKF